MCKITFSFIEPILKIEVEEGYHLSLEELYSNFVRAADSLCQEMERQRELGKPKRHLSLAYSKK